MKPLHDGDVDSRIHVSTAVIPTLVALGFLRLHGWEEKTHGRSSFTESIVTDFPADVTSMRSSL